LRSTCSAFIHTVGIVGVDLDGGDIAGAIEISLCLRQRHENEGGVVFRHADLENASDLVSLDPRGRTHRRHRPARRHERDAVADAQRKLLGQALADQDPLPFVEAVERVFRFGRRGDGRELRQVGAADTAHQHARGVEGRRRQRLALDDRRSQPHAGNLGDAIGNHLPVGQRGFERLDQQMTVEAQNLLEQFLPEPVHHRHHDDEVRHTKHDAEEGNQGNYRDESFLAPRTQIPQ
jgi:hypothetical protein